MGLKWSLKTLSVKILVSCLDLNSKFSWSNSNFPVLTPTFSKDGFLNSCFQNPNESSGQTDFPI